VNESQVGSEQSYMRYKNQESESPARNLLSKKELWARIRAREQELTQAKKLRQRDAPNKSTDRGTDFGFD